MHSTLKTVLYACLAVSANAATCGGFGTVSPGDCTACAQDLVNLGTQVCLADPNGPNYPPQFARCETCAVRGLSTTGQAVSSYCKDVGTAVQDFIAQCGESISGQTYASGNGDLEIQIFQKSN